MGNISAKTLGKKSKNKFRVLMVGLDESGKTTILYRLKMYETYKTEPTIGFNVEEFSNQNGKISMNIWDLGGKKHLRRLWRHYYPGTQVRKDFTPHHESNSHEFIIMNGFFSSSSNKRA